MCRQSNPKCTATPEASATRPRLPHRSTHQRRRPSNHSVPGSRTRGRERRTRIAGFFFDPQRRVVRRHGEALGRARAAAARGGLRRGSRDGCRREVGLEADLGFEPVGKIAIRQTTAELIKVFGVRPNVLLVEHRRSERAGGCFHGRDRRRSQTPSHTCPTGALQILPGVAQDLARSGRSGAERPAQAHRPGFSCAFPTDPPANYEPLRRPISTPRPSATASD